MVKKLGTHTAVLARRTASGKEKGHHLTLAGLEIDSKLLLKFAESFKAFNLDVRPVEMQSPDTGHERVITACVLRLNQTAVSCLRRSVWFLPRRTLLYGIGDWNEAARFCDIGINALLETTTDLSFQTAVSATRSVIVRGIGAYARVPIVTAVRIKAEGMAAKGITRNVGQGGMAVELARSVSLPDEISLDFSLPGARHFSLSASPRWYSGRLVGLRFEPRQSEKMLKKWIGEFSRLGSRD
ncbi:MAG TPA: PilZ domain-containing protein [Candidatus Acidoferrales bacterium]|nr:PilZ domain-containing protein [Candidatus Acidoferrales bacterium]